MFFQSIANSMEFDEGQNSVDKFQTLDDLHICDLHPQASSKMSH